jgi:integrase
MTEEPMPPLGVRLTVDVQAREGARRTTYYARVRWTHPVTHHREGVKRTHGSLEEARAWVERLEGAARTGVDPGQPLADYVAQLGDRWARGIDPTSTLDPYSAGLRKRVLPALGHLPVSMMSTGLIDRAIDQWEAAYGRSTVKNTIGALVLVLDEAVRDGLLVRNPAKDRARRRVVGRSAPPMAAKESPRDFALPDVRTLSRLVDEAVQRGGHQTWGDCVMILATTALRISEVAGLQVGDVDLPHGLLTVRRQTYPGRGGLVTKETKGRRRCPVPIIEPLRATLERLTMGRARDARLLVGPRGGVITTATLRDATGWDQLVDDLGLAGLVRHGLRHTALTWMADAGVELHLLQRVAGHQDPAVTSRYLHPDHQAVLDVGTAYSRWWAQSGPNSPALRLVEDGPVAG